MMENEDEYIEDVVVLLGETVNTVCGGVTSDMSC